VVERPASVVKELLENSLDAGSHEIRIDVENGGKRLIRVADDGCGMLRDDALLAFERHATSKLSDVKDLLAIATLGFRGEALPSIASVSRLLLETRSEEESTGVRVEIAGGKLLKVDESALNRGTAITVRDLFFNVPARKKFLRTEQTELAHIAQLVTHYSLAHPDKTFLLRNGLSELLAVTPVAQLRERVFQVFGSQTLSELSDLGEHTREAVADPGDPAQPYRLRGFLSGPQVQKLNRHSVYLFVNGRLIRDRLLMHALTAGYANLIPPGTYPFALLFLDCDPAEVDVNVHPSKTEVRFRNGTFVHDFVRDVVRGSLASARPISAMPHGASPVIEGQPGVIEGQPGTRLPWSEFSQRLQQGPVAGQRQEPLIPPAQWAQMMQAPADPAALPEVRLPGLFASPAEPLPVLTPERAGVRLPVPDTHGPLRLDSELYASGSMEALRDLRPLGQIHDSFIIAAAPDGLWIIDQHVAHERILFEQVLRQWSQGLIEKQQLLMPLVLELSPAQMVEFDRIAAELNALGFESEPFGKRAIAVKSAPADVGAGDVERIIHEILEIAERELRHASLDDRRCAMAASVACRAAIKINMPLTFAKMQWLLDALAQCEHPMSCPHGRPIALRYLTREILRGFHRI
jgi:DNA mismatch repair protein MutL